MIFLKIFREKFNFIDVLLLKIKIFSHFYHFTICLQDKIMNIDNFKLIPE